MPVIDAPKDPNGDRPLLPIGTYDFVVQSAEVETRKSDQKVQVVFKVLSRACTDRNGANKNATIRVPLDMTRMLVAVLDAMGVPHQTVKTAGGGEALRFDTDHCVQRTFRVTCSHNKGYERWSDYQPSAPADQAQQPAQMAPALYPPQAAPAAALPAPAPYMPPAGAPYQPPAGAPPQAAPQYAPQGHPQVAPEQQAPPPGYAAPYQPPAGAPPGYGYPPSGGYPPPQGGQGQGG